MSAQDGSPFEGKELELEYPCPWSYTVIGVDEERVRAAVAAIVGDAEHSVSFAHESRKGKYRSLHVEVVVRSDAQRLSIFSELHGHPDVAYVL